MMEENQALTSSSDFITDLFAETTSTGNVLSRCSRFSPQGDDFGDVDPLEHIHINGKVFIRTKFLAKYFKIRKSFDIWVYRFKVINIASHKQYWLCNACHIKPTRHYCHCHLYKITGSPENIKDYLWTCHNIDITGN